MEATSLNMCRTYLQFSTMTYQTASAMGATGKDEYGQRCNGRQGTLAFTPKIEFQGLSREMMGWEKRFARSLYLSLVFP